MSIWLLDPGDATLMVRMKTRIKTAWQYVIAHRKPIIFILITVILAIALVVTLVIALRPKPALKLAYQPVKACDLFTIKEAHTLLGKDVVGNVTDPVVAGDTATSKCSFTTLSADENAVTVAAVAVRSAVSKKGIAKNTDDFVTTAAQTGNQPVTDLGDKAYFNPTRGQLNILDGRQWLIISYGQGTAPEANTLDKDTELAHIVLDNLHKKK